MRQMWLLRIFACGVLCPCAATAEEALPRSLDSRIKIELFAEEPQLVTPTGIDVDHRGRVWVIESNTHFPPEGYKGHPSDRVLVMSDTDGDGQADRIALFTDGLTHAMSVALRPVWFAMATELKSGRDEELKSDKSPTGDSSTLQPLNSSTPFSVYVAMRGEIALFHDDDGDDKADRRERIVQLETKSVYPHNGLAGFAFDAIGWMYFGFGENEGAPYKLIGSDGTTLSGGGEGGSLYRCRLDGSKLERWATGFWNPHASCVDAFGRLFTVDNDADSRPPCRLLHIIKEGDYGFRYRNGRKGLHPFTSWNGEIPGTLPMVAGTGEAPSGILAYESDGLPEEYIGNLLVTSWGDHRIDRFRLKPKGASFESLAEPVIVGGENFRPVGIACAPNGSLYVSDWVLRDYKVHGRGRVWRISAVKPEGRTAVDLSSITPATPVAALVEGLDGARGNVRRASAAALQQTSEGRGELLKQLGNGSRSGRSRIEALWSIARIPIRVQAMLSDAPDIWPELLQFGEVGQATLRLVGSPQFPVESYVAAELRKNPKLGEKGSFGKAVSESALPERAHWLLAFLPLAKHFQFGGLASIVALDEKEPFLFAGVVNAFSENRESISEILGKSFPAKSGTESEGVASRNELAALLALRRLETGSNPAPQVLNSLRGALKSPDEGCRSAAVQWIGEKRIATLRPQVEAVLNNPAITSNLFLATLAALEMLDGTPPADFDKTPAGKYVLPIVKDDSRPASVRALALRMVDPNDPALDDTFLSKLLAVEDPSLKIEALRSLLLCTIKRPLTPYARLVAQDTVPVDVRAEAISGLARPGKQGKLAGHTRTMLIELLTDETPALRREALRSLRAYVADDNVVKEALEKLLKGKAKDPAWVKEEAKFALAGPGGSTSRLAGEALRKELAGPARKEDDATAGGRAFFRTDGAGCYKCHTVNGRGGRIGPDLTTIGRALAREKLVDSILEPSREIAPQFVTWACETAEGKVQTGMLVFENEGKTTLGDAEGNLTELKTIDIVNRVPQKTSVMPEKLAERMSVQEFRDLLAYLEGLR